MFFAVLLIIFLLGWLLIKLSPWMLVRWVNKKSGASGARGGRRYNTGDEGDVYVSRKDKRDDKLVDRDIGEYVDYEELDEDEE